MLAELLPSAVESAEVFGNGCDDGELLPAEKELVANASEKRRREFTGARVCARLALRRAGFRAAAILQGASGAPQWPPGVVGSLTHCDGYRAAAVARTEAFSAIGIDAEPNTPLPQGVLAKVASESERAALAKLARETPEICSDKLIFSAKEATYKAWSPATGRWLGFRDAEVEVDPGGTFTARLLVAGPLVGGRPLTAYEGRWAIGRGVVVTAVTVPSG
ncbi:MAG: 4'-phosphopantetheinyl transferase superfamily protein [Nocardiopsaceae bacterium]|jgi:4'-phosphopantetheinyl transferase EntD|nr:4'-phosphopantetheinyl transferase superfamily protein [Nocardiopsaceae bacterium]